MVTVASLLQILDYVGSLDSSRDLQSIRAKSFINRSYLILHACAQTFDVMFLGVKFWDENCSCFCVMVHLLELSPENTFTSTSFL